VLTFIMFFLSINNFTQPFNFSQPLNVFLVSIILKMCSSKYIGSLRVCTQSNKQLGQINLLQEMYIHS
jgi:hypothetical protein